MKWSGKQESLGIREFNVLGFESSFDSVWGIGKKIIGADVVLRDLKRDWEGGLTKIGSGIWNIGMIDGARGNTGQLTVLDDFRRTTWSGF